MTRRLFTLTGLAWSAGGQTASSDLQARLFETLQKRVQEMESNRDCVLGFTLMDLSTRAIASLRPDTQFAAASMIKVPILATVYAEATTGRLKLDTPIGLKPEDAMAGGQLYERVRAQPVSLTVRELLAAMIGSSDNTATNALIRLVGMPAVNRLLDTIGLPRTRLQRVMLDSAAAREGRENVSTPFDLVRLMELLHTGKLVNEASSLAMRELLRTGGREMRQAIRSSVPVSAKWGELSGVRGEVGLVELPGRPYALSVMATFLQDGDNPVGEIARAAHGVMERLAQSNAYRHRLQ